MKNEVELKVKCVSRLLEDLIIAAVLSNPALSTILLPMGPISRAQHDTECFSSFSIKGSPVGFSGCEIFSWSSGFRILKQTQGEIRD